MARELEMESSPVKDETGMYTLQINPEPDGRLKELDPGSLFFARGAVPLKKIRNKYHVFDARQFFRSRNGRRRACYGR